MKKTNHPPSEKQVITPDSTGAVGVRFFASKILPYKGWHRTFIPSLLIVLILLIATNVHAAWYSLNWQYRKAITIDGSQVVGGPHNDFPVLISITDTDLSAARADGNDLLFADSDEVTKLDHEIEFFDQGTGTLVAWVRIPAPGITNGTDKTLYLYYGYPTVPADQQNVAGTWNSNYRGVWHLAEQGATPASYSDSTANNNDGTSPTSHPTQVAGAIGPARDFDGTDDYITVADDLTLQLTTSITLEGWVWVRPNGFINFCCDVFPLLRKGEANPNGYQLGVRAYTPDTSTAGPGHAFLALDQGDDDGPVATNVIASGGTWYHLAATWDGTTERIFVDGSQVQSGPLAGPIALDTRPLYMGARQWEDYGNGRLDELRISSIARPPQWIGTQYNNQINPGVGGFLSAYGAQETASPTCDVDPNGTYIDAENFVSPLVPGADIGVFTVDNTTAGFNGTGYLFSSNGDTGNPPDDMRADYTVNFPAPGTYMVWMRGYAPDGGSDSVWIGLDGTPAGALNEGGTYNTWIWSNSLQVGTGSNQIVVGTAGPHTINLWVRESNHSVDGIYITTDLVSPIPGGAIIGIPTGATVIDPNNCGGSNSIAGTVYEDVNGDGDLTGDSGSPGVDLILFRDNGDNIPNGGDTAVGTATTDASGNYSFTALADDTYWVFVDSTTVSASAGLNGGFAQGDVWAEQTTGAAGAWCDDGAGSIAELAAAGNCFGGKDAAVSDDATGLATAEHVTRVIVSGGDVTGVDFGFSFNAIVSTRDGDDDGTANRTVQGSLNQFVRNANAVAGANASLFSIQLDDANFNTVVANAFTIQLTSALPVVVDNATTIDGSTQEASQGDQRPGAPDIVLDGINLGVDDHGLHLQASNSAIRKLDIRRFNNGAAAGVGTGIFLDGIAGGGDTNTIAENYLTLNSNDAGAIGALSITGAADSNTFDNNTFSANFSDGVRFADGLSTGNIFTNNVSTGNGEDGFKLLGNSITFTGNTVTLNGPAPADACGLEVSMLANSTVANNTITDNGLQGGVCFINNPSSDNTFGPNNTIERNAGPGINDSVSGGVNNRFTANSISDNGGLGIDLNDDGVTANDPGDADTGFNNLQNFPVLTQASTDGVDTTVIGTLSTTAATTFTLEFFSSTAADPSGYGEGETYLGADTVTTDGGGNVSFTIVIAGAAVAGGEFVTATATDPNGNTSEFSAPVTAMDCTGGRVTSDLQVLYDFTEGSGATVNDVSGAGAPLNLTIADPGNVTWIPGGGLSVDASTIIASAGPASKIITAAQASNEMTIEAWISPANTIQSGPSRIATLSVDTLNRNFTLHQETTNYGARVRTTDGDLNGTPLFQTDSTNDPVTTSLTHVMYTRDAAGTARLYVNGVEVASRFDATGTFGNWNAGYRFALANELTLNRTWLGEFYLAAVYSRALTPAEVCRNFTAGRPPAPTYSIIGSVYHDTDADADVAEVGTLTFSGATVHLYRDIGNAIIDGSEVWVNSTTTDGSGNYSFGGLTVGTYYTVVDSTTLDGAPYNGGFAIGDIWAEQTYAVSGAASGAGFTATAGALYGGRNAGISDDAAALTTAEHVIRRTIVAADATGVNFGFSFNAVVSTRGDATDDDGAGTNRVQQGTLRQFITNANAISGANAMRFVPAVATNAAGGGGNWWRIDVASVLPDITDAGITVDGTAYDLTDGISVVEPNPGQVGTGGTVGVDGLTLDRVDRPELEVNGDALAVGSGLVVDAGMVTIRSLAINRFGSAPLDAQIWVNATVTAAAGEAVITGNLIGTLADGSDAGGTQPLGISTNGAASISNNYIAFLQNNSVMMSQAFSGSANIEQVNFINNEVAFTTYAAGVTGDAVSDIAGGAVIRGNYIHDTVGFTTAETWWGKGIEFWYQTQNALIENNTIENMYTAGIGVNDGSSGNVIRRNIITGTTGDGANGGTGILVTSFNDTAASPPADNQITENAIYGNAGLGIDLDARSGVFNPAYVGDDVTENDGGGADDADTGANSLQNFPDLTSAASGGGDTTIVGIIDSAPSTVYTLEFFSSPSADADPSGNGEGRVYLGSDTVTSAADGTATYAIILSGVSVAAGDLITATATDPAGNTSEFSDAVVVVSGPPWYDGDWPYRDALVLAGSSFCTTVNGFPVPVAISGNAGLQGSAQPDGDDILFTLADGVTKVPHEIETFTKSSGDLVAWVKLDIVASADQTIYMYYGNASAANQENLPGLWDADYQGVWHLNEDVTDEATTGTHLDSTSNNNNGSQRRNVEGPGQIADGQVFDGSSDYIQVADDTSLDIAAEMTIEAWIRLPNVSSDQKIAGKTGPAPPPYYGYLLGVEAGQLYPEIWDSSGTAGGHYTFSAGSISPNEWTHVAVTWRTNDRMIGYINGAEVANIPNGANPIGTNNSSLIFGAAPWNPSTLEMNGTIDEIRISQKALDPAWIQAEVCTAGGIVPAIPTYVITGTVYEDVNGDGSLADAVTAAAVDVDLYRDGGDGQPDGGDDSSIATAATDAAGVFTFTGLGDGTYWVVVDSKTLSADTDVWAEQTYGTAGAWCDNGSGTTVERGTAGTCFGGQRADISDDTSLLNTAQHVTRVTIAGGTVTGVHFGFSFNAVVNTLAGDGQDDDGLTNRTVQGSLRQFIANANAIAGANAMRFVPAVTTNASGGGNNWWQISVTQALPAITDADTAIEGTAYEFTNGTTIRNTNNASLGYSGPVGLGADAAVGTGDEPTLSSINGPELEIVNDRATNPVNVGLDLQANGVAVRDIAIYGFGDTDIWLSNNIRVGIDGSATNYTNVLIEDSVIGTSAAGFADPGAVGRTAYNNIGIYHADSGFIRNNLIGYAGNFGIFLSGDAGGWTVQGNEIRGNGVTDSGRDGIDIGNDSNNTTVNGNLFAANAGSGIDSWSGAGSNLISNNTFDQNGAGGGETSAIRVFGNNSTIELNDFRDNAGPGVLVVANNLLWGPSHIPAIQNRISRNRFSNNGSNAIDLLADAGDANLGDGITIIPGTDANAGNIDLDFPVIIAAQLSAGTTTVVGTTCANCEVEVYQAVADGDGSDTSGADDYGEGVAYLGTANADAAGDWYLGGITALAAGDNVSAIAIDSSNNTSEFSMNAEVIITGSCPPIGGDILYLACFDDQIPNQVPVGWTVSVSGGNELVRIDGSTQVFSDGTGAGGPAVSGDPGWTDVSVFQRFRSVSGTINHAGVIARYVNDQNMVYGGIVTATTAEIWNRISNTWIQIGGTWTIPNVSSGWHTQELRIAGDRAELYIDGAFIGSATLSTGAPVAGKTGFWSQYGPEGYRDDHTVRLAYLLDGTIFEDADFAGTAAEYDGGVADLGLASVDVELYDAADVYIGSAATAADGSFQFIVHDGAYKVRARSATIGDADTPPAGGLNGTVPGTWPYPLAEMTWGSGAALYGGQDPTVNDTATGDNAGPGDTYVNVTVSGGNASGVNLGFAYNLITNTADDGAPDNTRSSQGSLRQYIKNANAIGTSGGTTANTSQFRIPTSDPNYNGSGSGEFTIQPASALPTITETVVLDAATQTVNIGDTNTAGPEVELEGSLAGAVNGLNISAGSSTLRGFAINQFSQHGVYISGGVSGNFIVGNYIGTDVTGSAAAGNGWMGVEVAGASTGNRIGGTAAADRNVISGNGQNGVSVIGGSDNTLIQGNYVGTNATGSGPIPNTMSGIGINGASTITIGGNIAGAGNVISGNTQQGIWMNTSSGPFIQGNTIGLNAAGDAAVANGGVGIVIEAGVSGAQIGGAAAVERNLISGNTGDGIFVNGADSTTIENNFIGTDAAGSADLGNGGDGILADNSADSTGITNNVISGNDDDGIDLKNSAGATIQGNYVGVSADGLSAMGNSQEGVLLDSTSGSTIGGTSASERNIVSGHLYGIRLSGAASTGNTVAGNYVGTDVNGTAAFGNTEHGVTLRLGAANNTIGGTAAGAGNLIAFNGIGVVLEATAGTGNAIQTNAIHTNTGLGIDLGNDGLTANDGNDGDTGPNALQNWPELTKTTSDVASTTITGRLNSTPNTTFRLEFFSSAAADPSGNGEGEEYLGFDTVTTNGGGNSLFNIVVPIAVATGNVITATATDPNGNTSEFGNAETVSDPFTISGTVYEDINGDASLADALRLAGVTASIYADGGDNQPDGVDDSLLGSAATNILGNYLFSNLSDSSTYWIVVDSKTVPRRDRQPRRTGCSRCLLRWPSNGGI
ncbi:MAG: hypothetical protein AMJ54_05645 [Deltaproteobacteria bacterium SG8_13]|nr:MAG: hypothetical protein AMJ54_05645 [Deltaproteobacteria bacterium SG8_13]